MKKLIKNLINVKKYRRLANTYKLKYEANLESQTEEKEMIIELQKKIISLQEVNIKQKEMILELQEEKLKKRK